MSLSVIPSFQPTDSVMARLEEAMESARKGEISMIAIATVERGGDACWCFSDLANHSTMLGAVERLKYSILKRAENEE